MLEQINAPETTAYTASTDALRTKLQQCNAEALDKYVKENDMSDITVATNMDVFPTAKEQVIQRKPTNITMQ